MARSTISVETSSPAVSNPGFRLLDIRLEDLTPELAERINKMAASATERLLDTKRVAHLTQKVRAGLMTPFHSAYAVYKDDPTKEVRVNGQHSSEMLVAMNGAFPEGGKVVLTRYEVDDDKAFALLFRQQDDRKSARSIADIAGAYQGLYAPLQQIPRDIAKIALESVMWWRQTVEKLPVPVGDDKYMAFEDPEIQAFAGWVNNLLTEKAPELTRREVLAACYASFRTDVAAASDFWRTVRREGDPNDEEAATTVLSKWLLTDVSRNRPGNWPDISARELYQGCAFAWNAHRAGRRIVAIKYVVGRTLHAFQ